MASARNKPREESREGTRERILAASLELFNEQGTPAVSTRHIAAAIGISPGNLYYHFGNKEEIVLCLYEEMEHDLSTILKPPSSQLGSFDDVLAYLDRLFAHLWKYRYFYRDLNLLIDTVTGLQDRYRLLAERTRANSHAIFAAMVASGWMRATERQIEVMTTNAWILMTHWLPYRQVIERRRTIRATDIADGVVHLVALFEPFLEAPQQRQLRRLLVSWSAGACPAARGSSRTASRRGGRGAGP
jgi:AcrR family transcriptional regulator